jgi:hypothetical protein
MRWTTVLRRLLGVTMIVVESALFRRDGTLTVCVRPTRRRSRCSACGQRAARYDRQVSELAGGVGHVSQFGSSVEKARVSGDLRMFGQPAIPKNKTPEDLSNPDIRSNLAHFCSAECLLPLTI